MKLGIIGSKYFNDASAYLASSFEIRKCLNMRNIESIITQRFLPSFKIAEQFAKENNIPLEILPDELDILEQCHVIFIGWQAGTEEETQKRLWLDTQDKRVSTYWFYF